MPYPSQYQQYIDKINKRGEVNNFDSFYWATYGQYGAYQYPYTDYSWVNCNNGLTDFRTAVPIQASPCNFFGINIVGSDNSYSYSISSSTLYPCWEDANWGYFQYGFNLNYGFSFYRGIYQAQSFNYTFSGTLEQCLIDMTKKFKNIRISVNGEIWDDPNPEYTWTSVPAISGKMGTISLATIDNSHLGNGSAVTGADYNYLTGKPASAEIGSVRNISVGQTIEFAWSGDNFKMTVTMLPPPTNKLELRFFLNQTTPGTWSAFYSYQITPDIFLISTTEQHKQYLGFIEDNENEVACLSIIDVVKNISTGIYTVNYNTPGTSMTAEDMHLLWGWLHGSFISDDPLDSFTDNEGDGGGTLINRVNNPIPEPSLPYLSATDTGFVSMYVIGKTELNHLAQFLWSDSFVNTVKKFFNDPMEILIGLMIFPLQPKNEYLGTSREIKGGSIATGVNGTPLTTQWGSYDFGSCTVEKRLKVDNSGKLEKDIVESGIYFDYSPYTECKIYLPYVGEHSLDLNDVMGRELHLTYSVDFMSGACCAHLTLVNQDDPDAQPECHYNFCGQMGVSVPISQADYRQKISAMMQFGLTAGSAIATVASGGLMAPPVNPNEVANFQGANVESSNPQNAISLGFGTASRLANSVANMHPTVQHTSGGGAISGSLSSEYPYITISEPDIFQAKNQPHYKGYPINATHKIGDMTGYVKIENVHLDGLSCTEKERGSIGSYLNKGVIVDKNGSSTPEHSAPAGELAVVFLKNKSDPETIGKTWTDSSKITGKLLYDNDIENIKLLVHGNYTAYNYCYIHELGRYYYINTFVIQKDGDFIVDMTVDALQSFKDEIFEIPALIDSAEDLDKAKLLMNNGYWFMKQNKIIKTLTFKKSGSDQFFDRSQNGDERFILTIAGDTLD